MFYVFKIVVNVLIKKKLVSLEIDFIINNKCYYF